MNHIPCPMVFLPSVVLQQLQQVCMLVENIPWPGFPAVSLAPECCSMNMLGGVLC
jgi:hypothetical protein